jgi:hypothetical protein
MENGNPIVDRLKVSQSIRCQPHLKERELHADSRHIAEVPICRLLPVKSPVQKINLAVSSFERSRPAADASREERSSCACRLR